MLLLQLVLTRFRGLEMDQLGMLGKTPEKLER
jgi:hypothetical protein